MSQALINFLAKVVNLTNGTIKTEINGSLAKLAEIATNTVITAGSVLTILPRAERTLYKTVRVSARTTTSATYTAVLYNKCGDTSLNTSMPTVFSVSASLAASGESRVDSNFVEVGLYNSGASDITLQYALVLGVI